VDQTGIIRVSGFQTGASVSVGGKTAAVTFVGMNTQETKSPELATGAQPILITNSDGESVSRNAAFTVNEIFPASPD